MNKKSQNVFEIIASIIMFVVIAAILLLASFNYLGSIQQSFIDSVCKFEVALRAVIVGSPIIQMLTSTFSFFTRGFTTITAGMFSGLNLQSCTPGTSLQTTFDDPITSSDFNILYKKISDESARCWDLFGSGNWDSLLYSRDGLSFTCWEDEVYIRCPAEYEEFSIDYIKENLRGYLVTGEYAFGAYTQSYYDIFPENMPVIGSSSYGIVCDGTPHKYYISLYFIDRLLMPVAASIVPIVCETIDVNGLGSDTLYLCIIGIGGGF